MDPDPPPAQEPVAPTPQPVAVAPGFELPSARQVVGRGLQLALDGSRDIRRASLYVGVLVAAVAAPAAVLLIVNLPTLLGLPWDNPVAITDEQARVLERLFGPLYGAGALALLGTVTVLVDGQLIAASLLAARLTGAPLSLREALARSRQVFWRYGAAAFAVGLLSGATSLLVSLLAGSFDRGESLGSSLIGTFVAAIVTAPFGYVLMGVVAGDVGGGTALRRSVTLARARPMLAAAVAAFAFLASALTVLGVGAAAGVVAEIGLVLHPEISSDAAAIVIAIPVAAAALVAYGSLSVTVAAITVAPQVAAFLGLTHYAAGLDRARSEPVGAAEGAAPAGSRGPRPARWVTIPMAILIGIEGLNALVGLGATSAVPG